jgi:16S rRNA (guanine527-N7)-methyltransferase
MTDAALSTTHLLHQLFTAAGRPLDPQRHEQFLVYLHELQHWNRHLNLTSISDEVGIIRKHFLGSLDFLLACAPYPRGPLLDIGTGAGFPGLPLKLWHPELAVDLVESSQRKSIFLRHLCHALRVENVRCLTTRVESLAADPTLYAHYAVIVSRGVGGLRRWLPAALALLQPDGRFVLEKGPEALTEVQALASVITAHDGELADFIAIPAESSMPRTLVVMTKPSRSPPLPHTSAPNMTHDPAGEKFDKDG